MGAAEPQTALKSTHRGGFTLFQHSAFCYSIGWVCTVASETRRGTVQGTTLVPRMKFDAVCAWPCADEKRADRPSVSASTVINLS
jgi:hypothetical protein